MNPATAFGVTFSDELIRCGLREVVLAPGSRSTPLAMAFYEAARQQRLRLHVRIDERSASFTALGLAKVVMGWPLQLSALAVMAWLLTRDRTPVAPEPPITEAPRPA